jgi:uncharacterized membrane protein
MESSVRSIAKSVSYRVLMTLVTIYVAWAITSDVAFAASIGIIDTLIKLNLYYFHERTWSRILLVRMRNRENFRAVNFSKAVSYRILGTVMTIFAAWTITGDMRFAAAIASIDFLIKTAAYYIHERAWGHINYGRVEVIRVRYNVL